MRLSLYEEKITWPGGSKLKPTGLMIPTHLNVLTIVEKPFVYRRPLNDSGDSCDPNKGEILCPHYNTEHESPKASSMYYNLLHTSFWGRGIKSKGCFI